MFISLSNLNDKIRNLKHDQKMNDLSAEIKQILHHHDLTTEQLSEQIKHLKLDQTILKQQAAETEQQLHGDAQYWMQLEVQHLLRMATHRVTLSYDVDGAMAALRAADARLLEINDVTLLPIRESIAQQIQALKNFEVPNYLALHMRIDSLNKKIKTILLDTQYNPSQDDQAQVKSTQVVNDSMDNLQTTDPHIQSTVDILLDASKALATQIIQSAKSFFNDSVNVTHGQQDSAEFLKHQEYRQTYAAVSILLIEAQYAITRRDNAIYKNQLDAVIKQLNSHSEFSQLDSIIENIKSASEVNLNPELPDISQPEKYLTEKITQSMVSK
jgi:uroporphyrin-3 C-methyltransferase